MSPVVAVCHFAPFTQRHEFGIALTQLLGVLANLWLLAGGPGKSKEYREGQSIEYREGGSEYEEGGGESVSDE